MTIELAEFNNRDDETILQFQQGDKRAFERLYDQFAPLLFSVILRIVENKKDAELALSKVFIKIWQNRRSYCPEKECFSIWLLSFARETAFSLSKNQMPPVLPDFDWKQNSGDCAEKLLDMILIFGKTLDEVCLLVDVPKDVLIKKLNQLFKTAIQKI